MVKFYVLVSKDVRLTKKRLLSHFDNWDNFHVIINTQDKDEEESLVELIEGYGIDYTVTESDGTPATGKNSLLKVFLESDNEYAVCIDGDDILTQHGYEFYSGLPFYDDHPPPDLLCLYRQQHIYWTDGDRLGSAQYLQDKSYKSSIAFMDEDEMYEMLIYRYKKYVGNIELTEEEIRTYRDMAFKRYRHNQIMNTYSERYEYMTRMVWFSRKAAELTNYNNNIVIGEDTIQFFKHKKIAQEGGLRMFIKKDGRGVEPTYITYMGNHSITREKDKNFWTYKPYETYDISDNQNLNDTLPHSIEFRQKTANAGVDIYGWEWLPSFAEAVEEVREEGNLPSPDFSLPQWKIGLVRRKEVINT